MATKELIIGFDADDTLWHNETNFERVHERYRALLAQYHDAATVDAALLATERRNIPLYGYGVKGFTLSAVETAKMHRLENLRTRLLDDEKTLHAIAEAQRAGGVCAFIDAEHALDVNYARKLGVKVDELLVSQPDNGEQALEIADMLVRSGAIDILVIDSVAALVPRAEIEGEMGDSHVGLQARLMSQALRKMTGALNNSGTTAIFINQLREKIGVMFGSPETTTGGKALKFYASVRMDVRRIETLKDGTDAVGNRTRVKIVKNKVAPPFKQAEFDILYGRGISREGSLIDMGVEHGFIRKSGSWFTYDGEQLGQGKENARNYLLQNVDAANEIEKKIKEKLGIGAVLTDGAADDVLPAPVDF